MGYYPIKCVRCAAILSNKDVLFDTEDITVIREETRVETIVASEKQNEWSDDIRDNTDDTAEEAGTNIATEVQYEWNDDVQDDTDDSAEEASIRDEKRYMTYEEIKAKYADVELFETRVSVSGDFQDTEQARSKENLWSGVLYTDNEKGYRRIRATRRICPLCADGKDVQELPPQSGMMPTYDITLIGSTSSGKTVYLCALKQILSIAQGNLPYHSNLNCIPVGKMSKALEGYTNTLFVEGKLPFSTARLWNEPLVLKLRYYLPQNSVLQTAQAEKECLIALSDMKGEDMTAEARRNLELRGPFLSKADAFMFIVSPLNMFRIYMGIPIKDREQLGKNETTAHSKMMANIDAYLRPFFETGHIEAPCVVMLSKSDLLHRYAQSIGIALNNPVVAIEPPNPYFGQYFRTLGEGVEAILWNGEPTLYSYIGEVFKNVEYTSFSSLGPLAIIDYKNQKVRGRFDPIRLVDPLLLLLIKLGFLPPFTSMEFVEEAKSESSKRKKARRSTSRDTAEDTNRYLMQKWIMECTV